MRLLLTAVTCPKGAVDQNLARHLELLERGQDTGCALVLLPEMSLTGYCPSRALTLDDAAVRALVRTTRNGPAVSFGFVEEATVGPPYVCQLVADGGEVVAVHRKARLGEGEDGVFQPGTPAATFEVAGVPCSMAVCAEIGAPSPYRIDARLVLGPAAPGLYGDRRSTDEEWESGFSWWREQVVDDALGLLRRDQFLAVSTQAGATEDEDFPGWAGLVGADPGVVAELPDWREGNLVVDLDL
jgi:predicted amidohydrolase